MTIAEYMQPLALELSFYHMDADDVYAKFDVDKNYLLSVKEIKAMY